MGGSFDEAIGLLTAELIDDESPFSRYAWPAIWLGNRIAADPA